MNDGWNCIYPDCLKGQDTASNVDSFVLFFERIDEPRYYL